MSRLFHTGSSSRARRTISWVITITLLLPMVAPYASVSHASAPVPATPVQAQTQAETQVRHGGLPVPPTANHDPLLPYMQAGNSKGSDSGGVEVIPNATTMITWTYGPDLPTPRAGAAVVTDRNGNIYVIGGRNQYYQPTNVVEVYVPSQGLWYCSYGDYASGCAAQIYRPLPTPRTSMAVATYPYNGYPYFFLMGGRSADQYGESVMDRVEIYSPFANTWYCSYYLAGRCDPSWGPYPLPTKRAFAAGAAGPDGTIYAIGGQIPSGSDPNGPLSQAVEAWNPYTGLWYCSYWDYGDSGGCQAQIYPPMPSARHAMGAALASNGLLYLVGGASNPGTLNPTNKVEAYDTYLNLQFGPSAQPTAYATSAYPPLFSTTPSCRTGTTCAPTHKQAVRLSPAVVAYSLR